MVRTMTRKGDLTEGVVWKKLLLFFLPIAAGTLIQQLYNAVDGLVVSKFVGTEALAAVGGSAAMIINVLIGFFVAVTSGASVIIAQIYGAGNDENVKTATNNAVAVCAIIGAVLMVFGLFTTPWMLTLLKTPEDTVAASIVYLRIYFIGVPFILILNMESNLMRAVGNSTAPFIYMVISSIANVILDLVFVLVFNMGVAGVAIATVISQVINMTLLSVDLLKTDKPYRLTPGKIRLNWQYIRSMMRIGIPSGAQSLMYSVSNTIIQVAVNTLGTVVVASWAMTGKTDGFYWAVSSAFGAAVTAFIGQNLGAGKHDRIKLCVRQGLVIALIMTVVTGVILMAVAKPFLVLLSDDQEVRDTTFIIMTYFVPYYFIWSFIEVLSAVLRGSGDALPPVIIIGIGICLFRIIWMQTVFAYFGTLLSLCLSYIASWVVTAVALIIYYKKGKWLERQAARLKE